MLLGFRAGADAGLKLKAEAFTATATAWGLPAQPMIGRVFPADPFIGPAENTAAMLKRLDAAVAPVLAAGMMPYVSLKPDVSATIAGAMDKVLDVVARWATLQGTRVYLSLHHEPQNDAMDAGDGPKHGNHLGRAVNFTTMHDRAYAVMKPVAQDLLHIGPCHLVMQWAPGSASTADGAVAEAWRVTHADFVAADSYTSNWSWTSSGTTLRGKRDFQRWLRLCSPDPSKLVLAERGITRNGPSSPDLQGAILADDLLYLDGLGAHAYLYWSSGGANDDSIYLLGPAGRAVLAQHASQPIGDRYNEGRHDAFEEVAAWALTQRKA